MDCDPIVLKELQVPGGAGSRFAVGSSANVSAPVLELKRFSARFEEKRPRHKRSRCSGVLMLVSIRPNQDSIKDSSLPNKDSIKDSLLQNKDSNSELSRQVMESPNQTNHTNQHTQQIFQYLHIHIFQTKPHSDKEETSTRTNRRWDGSRTPSCNKSSGACARVLN